MTNTYHFDSQTGAHREEGQQEGQGTQGCRRGLLEDSFRSLSALPCFASAVGVGISIGVYDPYASVHMIMTRQVCMSDINSMLKHIAPPPSKHESLERASIVAIMRLLLHHARLSNCGYMDSVFVRRAISLA